MGLIPITSSKSSGRRFDSMPSAPMWGCSLIGKTSLLQGEVQGSSPCDSTKSLAIVKIVQIMDKKEYANTETREFHT